MWVLLPILKQRVHLQFLKGETAVPRWRSFFLPLAFQYGVAARAVAACNPAYMISSPAVLTLPVILPRLACCPFLVRCAEPMDGSMDGWTDGWIFQSVRAFARSCMNYSLGKGWDLFLSTKNTILKVRTSTYVCASALHGVQRAVPFGAAGTANRSIS